MIRRQRTKRGDQVRITFELPGDIGDACVVGDFNSWCVGATPLKPRGDLRSASLTLAVGKRYAFRYVASGRWFNDIDADDWVANEFGETDAVLDLT
jgi:hypothetical protein